MHAPRVGVKLDLEIKFKIYMKSELSKNSQSNILIPILIGIILFYCQPFLKYFGDKTIDFLISISSTFSNFYYSAMGYNTTSIILFSTNYLVILIIAFGILSFLSYLTDKVNTSIKKTKELLNEIDGNKKIETINDPEVLKAKIIKLMEINNKRLVGHKKIGLPIVYAISGLSICVFFGIFQFTSSIDTKKYIFEHSLTIIAPSVDDHMIKNLKSDWAQIKNKNDYIKINLKIDSLKNIYHIK